MRRGALQGLPENFFGKCWELWTSPGTFAQRAPHVRCQKMMLYTGTKSILKSGAQVYMLKLEEMAGWHYYYERYKRIERIYQS